MAETGPGFAADTTKQIITLSTGLIALTVTFAEKFTPTGQDISVPWQLAWCWIAFGLTVVFGVWSLMAISGVVNKAAFENEIADANASSIRIPALLMVLSFLIGLGLAIAAGFARFG